MSEDFIVRGPKQYKIETTDSIGEYIYNRLLQYGNVPVALADATSNEVMSYRALLETSRNLAAWLQNLNTGQDDVIGIFSENNVEYFCPVLAALYLGNPITTFNPQYTHDELINGLNISKPSIIFCSEWTVDTLLEIRQHFKFIKTIIVINTEEENVNGIQSVRSIVSASSNLDLHNFKPNKIDSIDRTVFILYSSGTTGLPKGVMLSHKNLHYVMSYSTDSRYSPQHAPGHNTVVGLLPFFHYYGLVSTLYGIQAGRKILVMKSFDPELFLSTLQNYKVTSLNIVPSLANFLAKSPLLDNYDLSSIVTVTCGAAPLSKKTQEMLIKRLNVKTFLQGYGLTEATPILGFCVGDQKSGSCGQVLPGISVKIVDPKTENALGPEKSGELCCKGDMVMKGYANNDMATKQAFDENGWLHTGDVAYYDKDGYFYIVDRIKELIKYKAFQVPPAELEAILLSHPKILDAGVIGLPDEEAGELPLAFVVVEYDESLTEEEVKNFLARKVSPQKQLRGGVRFIDEIPRNPSGKILRRKLKELVVLQKSKL